jgi:TolB protein
MMTRFLPLFVLLASSVLAAPVDQGVGSANAAKVPTPTFSRPMENYSPDDTRVVFEAVRDGQACQQVFLANADGADVRLLSSGKGTAGGASFFPDGKRVVYSQSAACSAALANVPTFPNSDLFVVNADGTGRRQLTRNAGYNGEATVSPDGRTIAFTSTRDGNPNLYSMDAEGNHLTRLTDELGYDGSPLFSPDGQWIAYRAYHPQTPQEIASYHNLLKQRQSIEETELWIMRADGTAKRQLTNNAADLVPYFSADSKRIVFGTKFGHSGESRQFDLYSFRLDGTTLERLTHTYLAPDDLAREERSEDKYAISQENRKKLREPLGFGILKVFAYFFAGIVLCLLLLKVAVALVTSSKTAAERAERWLGRISRMLFNSASGVDRQANVLPRGLHEKRRARSTTLQKH